MPQSIDEAHSNYNGECFSGCSFHSQPTSRPSDTDSSYLAASLDAVEPNYGRTVHCPSEQDIYREIVAECAQFDERKESLASQSLPSEMNTTNEAAPENARTTVSELSHRFLSDNLTIEEFVKLVLAVIKENSFCPSKHRNQESSEEILRKKRLQNNEAAARYRKRQKELREETEIEVRLLENKNQQLKDQIEAMQREIEILKREVLRTSHQ
ncbi:unnamed protein product [Enterobius vermicularis]|uniref:BZIP domain-containing protein n=1 Tax=Enterobius vermicularis TaxID=51028 RepID=A0A0N4VBW1_ENTVE|nr:unnamed protein product [Enterobius vermicularis]